MFVKRISALLLVLAAVLLCVPVSYAENGLSFIQGCAWEDNMDVYISGEIDVDTLTCKISNQEAEAVDKGLLTDGNVLIRTTILLDISTSMPAQMRGSVQEYIDDYIKNLNGEEELRLVTFCDQLNVLQDFTSDRYDLASAADKIQFNGMASMIYDAVYHTIPEIKPVDDRPCYYRTIVITDGVDRAETGITKEELYLRLQSETYPVDIVAVGIESRQNPEKELSALARISSGRYANLNSGVGIDKLREDLNLDNICWIRLAVPEQLLDGSTRQIDITSGGRSLQFDFKVPVYGETAAASSESVPEVSSQPPASSETSSIEPSQPVLPESSEPETPHVQTEPINPPERVSPVVIGIAAAGAVVLVLVIISVILLSGKNKKAEKSKGDTKDKIPTAPKSSNTIIISDEGAETFTIRLRNTSNSDQIWNFKNMDNILIGRSTECQVCIDDMSVSRKQCKIYWGKDNAPVIENISNANITELNGKRISEPSRISEGDKIKCGYVELMVDFLSCLEDSRNRKPIGNSTKYINV